jgi:hypothetical protein
METTPNTTTTLTAKVFPKKACEECGTEFEVKKHGARFCSDICRYRAHRKGKKSSGPGTIDDRDDAGDFPSTKMVTSLNGLSPQAQYIITHLRDQLKEQKEEARRLRDKYEAERTQKEALKDKLQQLETDHKIEAIQNSKPSGLQGIVSGLGQLPPEVLQTLGQSLGPVLGRLTEKLFGGGASPAGLPMAGTDGQLDEAQGKVLQFNQWFIGLSKPLQEGVYAILVRIANQPSEDQLQQILMRIQTLLNNGTTTPNPAPFTGTFN